MDNADILLAGVIASTVLQSVKRYAPSDLYGVVLIAAGLIAGLGIGYARHGLTGLAPGAVDGIGGALGAAGVYSIGKAAAQVE